MTTEKPLHTRPIGPVTFLSSDRLYLRPLEAEDMHLLQLWQNDPHIRHQLDVTFPTDREKQRRWFLDMDRTALPRNLWFAVVRKDNDAFIGTQSIKEIDWLHRNAYSGSLIGDPTLRGQGYGPEAKHLTLQYCFDTLGLERVAGKVLATNAASIKALLKCGYQVEGRLRRALYIDGAWHDDVILGVLAEDWRRLGAAKATRSIITPAPPLDALPEDTE